MDQTQVGYRKHGEITMPIIDSHAHVFTELCGFGADGELRSIGGGKVCWAIGVVIDLIPQSYGDTLL